MDTRTSRIGRELLYFLACDYWIIDLSEGKQADASAKSIVRHRKGKIRCTGCPRDRGGCLDLIQYA